MTFINIILLCIVMISLALIPSASVALVVTRSATLGLANGIAVSLGIVLGDIVFIFLAIFGLSIVAETMGELFLIIRYLGGLYLIWLGYSLFKSAAKLPVTINHAKSKNNIIGSFCAGFFLTLGDIKAIFFYASLFPAFIDLSALKWLDVLIILLLTVVTVGGVKVFYAVFARKVADMSAGLKLETGAKRLAGGFMAGVGSYVILKA